MKKEFYLSTAVYKLDELIKTSGYKPKSKVGSECTSLVVEQELRECEAPGPIRNSRINDVMKKIEKELNSNNSDSEFFINCRDVVSKLNVNIDRTRKYWKLKEKIWNYQLGFLASLVNNVIKEEKAPPKENLSHLGWIGTEKKRGNFFVKLTEYIENYGLHKVVDKTGNRGIFFSFSGTDKIAKGDCFLMKATPSRHQINKYDGGKETYFNRVIIEENKGGT